MMFDIFYNWQNRRGGYISITINSQKAHKRV